MEVVRKGREKGQRDGGFVYRRILIGLRFSRADRVEMETTTSSLAWATSHVC